MFRRLRYRKWLVAGLGAAALVFPASALGGSSGYGAPDGWYPWAVSVTKQAQTPILDGRNPDTVDAALAAHPKLDPMIVKYLERYGYTRNQIDAMATPAASTAKPKLDPMIVKYLERYGYTRKQIFALAATPAPTLTSQNVQQTPVDGRSPDTIDFAALAHSPVVTVERTPGFQWGDFGIGLSAAMLVIALLGITRLLSNRSQRPVTTN
jgi:hypothetical protein